jgi:hypothetical protein
LFHADRRMDGQTDVMNLIVAFRCFSKRTKMYFRRESLVLLGIEKDYFARERSLVCIYLEILFFVF